MPNLECPSFIGFRYKNSPSTEPEIGIRPTSFWHLPQFDIFLNGWYNLLSFSCVENNCCYIPRGAILTFLLAGRETQIEFRGIESRPQGKNQLEPKLDGLWAEVLYRFPI